MKKLFLFSFTVVLLNSVCQATIRRVQYWGLPVSGVDYATGDAAVAASAVGDTILVFQSTNSSFTINKRLVIIGPGYWNWAGVDANFNAGLQNIQPAAAGSINITFAAGSDSTIVTGCVLTLQTSGNTGIKNIKLRNCATNTFWYIGHGTDLVFDNWELSKCYLTYGIYGFNGTRIKITNLKMFNCIADGAVGWPALSLSAELGQTGIIENCSFTAAGGNFNLTFNGFLIQNCIFHNSNPTQFTNSVFNNNVFYNTPSPTITGAGNVFNATAANFYTGLPTQGTNSYDGKFKLKAGSPAIGAGIGGIDAGAYGGVNPYKLSLIPAIPAFYKLTSPSTATAGNPYQITFSVRANN